MYFTGGKDEPGNYHCTKASFINDIDQFNPLEFGILAKEAAHFDSMIRLSLEAAHTVSVLLALASLFMFHRHSKILVLITGVPTLVSPSETCLPPQMNLMMIGMRSTTIMGWGIVSPSTQIISRLHLTFMVLPLLLIPVCRHCRPMAELIRYFIACSAFATAIHLTLCSIKLGEIDQALVIGQYDNDQTWILCRI